jgi:hypothetical protein
VRDGQPVSGKLDTDGQRHVYQLDLGEAQEFQFVDVTGAIDFEPEKPQLWRAAPVPGAYGIAEPSPPARRVVVSGRQGDYSFRVVAHKQRRVDVRLGDRIGAGGWTCRVGWTSTHSAPVMPARPSLAEPCGGPCLSIVACTARGRSALARGLRVLCAGGR